MSEKSVMSSMAITNGILSSVLVVFITLKLAGVLPWSWWLIFAPVWLPFVGILFGAVAAMLVGLLVVAWADWRTHKRS